jgi:hypothetical protein
MSGTSAQSHAHRINPTHPPLRSLLCASVFEARPVLSVTSSPLAAVAVEIGCGDRVGGAELWEPIGRVRKMRLAVVDVEILRLVVFGNDDRVEVTVGVEICSSGFHASHAETRGIGQR